jgi:hypothetical protein
LSVAIVDCLASNSVPFAKKGDVRDKEEVEDEADAKASEE